MGINYKSLLEQFSADAGRASANLRAGFKERHLRPQDFDLGRLFCECFGMNSYYACRSDRANLARDVMESSGAVNTTMFQNISGQIVFSAVQEAYEAPEYVFTKLIPTVPTSFSGEKIPGITGIGDEATVVNEGDPYPLVGVSESWFETAQTKKRGMIVPVTREAIFFDRTGILLERCKDVGTYLGLNKEKRAIDCVIDENGGATSIQSGGHRYYYKGNSIATYGDSSGTHNWDNLAATNTLLDYSDIENAELLLDAMVDPDHAEATGKYRAAATDLVVASQLLHTAKQILNATEVRIHVAGYPTSGNLVDRASANTLQPYQIRTSPLVAARLGTDTSWYVGSIAKAFRYMENWPMQTKEAPSNSLDEFHRDIVQQFRVDERGAFATFDPRYMIKSTVA